jgi:hypothetical protein
MTKPLNSGQRLARGVAIIAAVEPEADAQIYAETLHYGRDDAPYSREQRAELVILGWFPEGGSWAFYT